MDIVNNYASISFNFGPTLLSWIEDHNPDLYHQIIQADRKSQERFSGHGSAIAQVYNHIIMPLATRRDKETEIIWGIRDFVSRFSRMPEGMWLAETAVDTETLEILAEQGILFTILSPYQARRIRKSAGSSWELTDPQKLDAGRPYLCRLPSGRSIALFFYDYAIAGEIAFGSLLSNGEQFADRMISTFSGRDDSPRLLSIATDGETYGHHHRFADMALAYALNIIEEKKLAKITIFGEYLENHPPEYVVEIYENTSWSCNHGVERWKSDCGCRTYHACLISDPGECISLANTTPPNNPRLWNQKWRGPLREAMDNLNNSLSVMYKKEAGLLLSDPRAARNEYIDLILEKSEDRLTRFVSQHMIPGISSDQIVRALKLLEVQHNALLMYTSCGWFFDELSGIETVQVMMYACRAIQLTQELTGFDYEPAYTGILSRAVSNIPSNGSGADIYENYVKTAVVDKDQIACFYAISALLSGSIKDTSLYTYQIRCGQCRLERADNLGLMTSTAFFRSELTHEEFHLVIASVWLGEMVYVGGTKKFVSEDDFAQMEQDLWDAFGRRDNQGIIHNLKKNCDAMIPYRKIFPDGRRKIQESVLATTMRDLESHLYELFPGDIALMPSLKGEGITPPTILTSLEQFILNAEVRRCLENGTIGIPLLKKAVTRLILSRATPDTRLLSSSATSRISRDVKKIMFEPYSVQKIRDLNLLLRALKPLSLPLDLRESQNIYFANYSRCIDQVRRNVENDKELHQWIDEFQELGKYFDIVYDVASSSEENHSPNPL
ncbi:DUF3536 domain-containing protein [Methanospirillum lacunae]|uniref:DUF3536 domain-containing protein n=1 Tax=Methanospirillum lacunae TaxID=668570 RepID=UPI0038FCFAB4